MVQNFVHILSFSEGTCVSWIPDPSSKDPPELSKQMFETT